MSEYKMNQYDLQSYFKSLCNSFYIAYEHVKRLKKEEKDLINSYNEEDLEIVKGLLGIEACITVPNKYVTLAYSYEKLEKEKERLEAEEQEFERKIEEIGKIRSFWSDNMWKDIEAIKSVIYKMTDEGYSIIVTTKEEIYALVWFYYCHSVKDFPIINMDEEGRQAFPNIEELSDDFIFAYEQALDKGEKERNSMSPLYNKYF